jgi:hypothetical protein
MRNADINGSARCNTLASSTSIFLQNPPPPFPIPKHSAKTPSEQPKARSDDEGAFRARGKHRAAVVAAGLVPAAMIAGGLVWACADSSCYPDWKLGASSYACGGQAAMNPAMTRAST